MKRALLALLGVIGLLYPLAVYFGIEHLSTRFFALLLALVWLGRLAFAPKSATNPWLLAAVLGFCLVLAWFDNQTLLRWYPVLVNCGLMLLFTASLYRGTPIIERLARLQEPDLPPQGVAYTRRVTQVWIVFFLFNATAAAVLTLWAPLSWWTLYNGLIAYLLIGLLFAGEYLVRQRVRNRP